MKARVVSLVRQTAQSYKMTLQNLLMVTAKEKKTTQISHSDLAIYVLQTSSPAPSSTDFTFLLRGTTNLLSARIYLNSRFLCSLSLLLSVTIVARVYCLVLSVLATLKVNTTKTKALFFHERRIRLRNYRGASRKGILLLILISIAVRFNR